MVAKLTKEVLKQLNEAWLKSYCEDEPSYNPLDLLRTEDSDEFEKRLIWLLTQPDYFAFLVKYIFNVELLPFQVVILTELWKRKFPMLIATRGAGKAVAPDMPVLTPSGWNPISNLNIGDSVYGSNGEEATVLSKTSLQKSLEFYRITLRDGRSIECCEDHLWKVWDKNKNQVKGKDIIWSEITTKQMHSNYFNIRKDSKSNSPKTLKEYRFAIPSNESIKTFPTKDFIVHPYIVGVLLGDGCITQNTTTITSNDTEIIDKVKKLLPYGYTISSHESSVYGHGIIIDKSVDSDVTRFSDLLREIGIWGLNSHNKYIPDEYLFSDESQRLELLKGLMDTDGTSNCKNTVEYYTVSNRLSDNVLDLIRSLGISCRHSIKESWFNEERYSDCNRITVYTDKPVFSLNRKLQYVNHIKSKAGQSKYSKSFIVNIEYIGKKDGICISVDSYDKTYIIKDYVVTHNSFLLGLYSLMRCLVMPNRKVIVAGAAFRQSRFVHEYMETIWKNAPVLRDLCDQDSGETRSTDMCRMTINGSTVTSIPIGTGEKIRGYRCQDLLAEEFGSHTQEIFETVLAGFGNVSALPSEVVKKRAAKKLAVQMEIDPDLLGGDSLGHMGNQIVICGTATYDFNHFATYWKKYKQIIHSKGNQRELEKIFPEGIEKGFDWRYYSIIRLPYDSLPEGFLDDGNVARSKASVHSGIFGMEFGAYFCKDSKGFFKRSMIERCVANASNEIHLSEGQIVYDALVKGRPDCRYVIGIDPASEIDNFCIVVIELHQDHRRIVHCWTTTRESHKERVRLGLTTEDNFYSYCARRIRDLMRIFPTERIMLDSQGGGIAISEALHETSNLAPGELPIWPVIDEDKEKDTDDLAGLHLIDMVNFAKAEWTSEANHGMRKDFEDRVLLFPKFDPIVLEIAVEQDKLNNKLYDTLEDCVMEIEEMKNELVLIEITQTATGRDKWDTPEIKVSGSKKGKMRKDRYSALLMANMGARNISLVEAAQYMSYGGFAEHASLDNKKVPAEFIGPAWFTAGMKDVYS